MSALSHSIRFTLDDLAVSLKSLDALEEYGAPPDILPQIDSLRFKLVSAGPTPTPREIAILRTALQIYLESNALDYRASKLLTRLAPPSSGAHTHNPDEC